jgi:hypothetical protein
MNDKQHRLKTYKSIYSGKGAYGKNGRKVLDEINVDDYYNIRKLLTGPIFDDYLRSILLPNKYPTVNNLEHMLLQYTRDYNRKAANRMTIEEFNNELEFLKSIYKDPEIGDLYFKRELEDEINPEVLYTLAENLGVSTVSVVPTDILIDRILNHRDKESIVENKVENRKDTIKKNPKDKINKLFKQKID